MKLAEITKAIAGALTAGGAAFTTAAGDGDVTGTEWATVAVAAVLALGAVWAVASPALKAVAGVVATAIGGWSNAYSDGAVTSIEWATILVGLAAALLLVGGVDNSPPAGRHQA